MTRIAWLLGVVAVAGSLAGCGHALGYAGKHPGQITCKGKGNITGTGAATVSAGIGGSEMNSFSITADCGEGFSFSQGPPTPETK